MKLFHWRAEFKGTTYELFTSARSAERARKVLFHQAVSPSLPPAAQETLLEALRGEPYFTAESNYPIVVCYRKEVHA